MPVITAGMKLTAERLNNITPSYREVVSADQTSSANNTTLFNITDLLHAVDSGTVYRFFICLIYMASTTADFKMALTGPSGATLGDWRFSAVNSAGTEVIGISNAGAVNGLGGLGATTRAVMLGSGIITIGGTSGNIQVQAAKNAAEASTLTVVKGSFMDLEELV